MQSAKPEISSRFEFDQSMIGRCKLPIYTALLRLYFNMTLPPIFFLLRIFQLWRFYHIFSLIRALSFLDRFASTLVTAFEQSTWVMAAEWESHREVLKALYLEKDKSLVEVQKHLAESYGFNAS